MVYTADGVQPYPTNAEEIQQRDTVFGTIHAKHVIQNCYTERLDKKDMKFMWTPNHEYAFKETNM